MKQDWSWDTSYRPYGRWSTGRDEHGRVVIEGILEHEAKRVVDRANSRGRLPNECFVTIDGVRYYDLDKLYDMSNSAEGPRDQGAGAAGQARVPEAEVVVPGRKVQEDGQVQPPRGR